MSRDPRRATIHRRTNETEIYLELDLDGTGQYDISTGVGFLDHMLAQVARHGQIDLSIRASGDVHVDFHHTAEDVGIVLGDAIRQALGSKAGISRYGSALVPMDEALVQCALDLSGRPFVSCTLPVSGKVGQFDAELAEEVFRAIAVHSGMTLHLTALAGKNAHHVIEAAFKAFARALRVAKEHEPGSTEIPSTKGVL